MVMVDETMRAQYLTLVLADGLYAVSLGAVKDIRGATVPMPLEEVPAYVTGYLEHPLGHLPVLDLRHRLDLPAATAATPAVHVVLQHGELCFALRADAVADVVEFGLPAPPAGGVAADARAGLAWLRGAAPVGERMALVLDLGQLLAPADREAVAAALASTATPTA